MRQLRTVRERVQDLGSEFDLRDLGGDPLILESHPMAVLVVHTHHLKTVNEMALLHGLVTHVLERQGEIVIHTAKQIPGEHKTQAVHLYLFYMSIVKHLENDAWAHLFELQRLRFSLVDAIRRTYHTLMDKVFSQHQSDSHSLAPYCLAIGCHTAHHLQQAGFAVVSNGAESICLSHDEVMQHHHALKAAEKASAERRVG